MAMTSFSANQGTTVPYYPTPTVIKFLKSLPFNKNGCLYNSVKLQRYTVYRIHPY